MTLGILTGSLWAGIHWGNYCRNEPSNRKMDLIDKLFFPGVFIARILLWAFATYDKKLASERIYASSLRAKQRKTRA